MQSLVISELQNAIWLVAHHLHVFLRGSLGGIPRSSLHRDASLEYPAEVGDAEQENEQHGEHEGKFDERLPPVMTVPLANPTSPQVSQ